jgi:hypothetical protein
MVFLENIIKSFEISAVVHAASIGLNHTKYDPAYYAVGLQGGSTCNGTYEKVIDIYLNLVRN